MSVSSYVGRFAPSPTGMLHFRSLVTAVASYADAKHNEGQWILRIDDLDSPRVVEGSAKTIVDTLDRFGFSWEEPIRWQSARVHQYREVITRLVKEGLAYSCRCSRREIAKIGTPGVDGPIYPGTCRSWDGKGAARTAIRLRSTDTPIHFEDRLLGYYRQNLETEVGDFVIYRADEMTAYQLAVVVDDHLDQVTHVVRGADLLQSTPRQIFLARQLGFRIPSFAHLPLALDADGKKISKSAQGASVDPTDPMPALKQAWHFLGQDALKEDIDTVDEFWFEAIPRWSAEKLATRSPADASRSA